MQRLLLAGFLLATMGLVIDGCSFLTAGQDNKPAIPAAVIRSEFIFETAPFPSAHASTIAETQGGLVAAWFGGTREGADDVGIWLSRYAGGKWSGAGRGRQRQASGRQAAPLLEPGAVPVRRRRADALLQGRAEPQTWWGMLRTSRDGGRTWSDGAALAGRHSRSDQEQAGAARRRDDHRVQQHRDARGAERGASTSSAASTAGGPGPRCEPPAPADGTSDRRHPAEHPVHPAGRLQAVGRTRSGRVFETWSTDGGKTWTPTTLTALPNPNAGTDAVTLGTAATCSSTTTRRRGGRR